jgi:transcription termination factor NusB
VNFEIPSIPVTLNEYLELAKEYSTPKSSILSTEWTIG